MVVVPSYISREPYEKQFKAATKEWKRVFKEGADIDVWSDGLVLNLIRSKMIRLRNLERSNNQDADFSGWVIPEKVSFLYYAKNNKKNRR